MENEMNCTGLSFQVWLLEVGTYWNCFIFKLEATALLKCNLIIFGFGNVVKKKYWLFESLERSPCFASLPLWKLACSAWMLHLWGLERAGSKAKAGLPCWSWSPVSFNALAQPWHPSYCGRSLLSFRVLLDVAFDFPRAPSDWRVSVLLSTERAFWKTPCGKHRAWQPR